VPLSRLTVWTWLVAAGCSGVTTPPRVHRPAMHAPNPAPAQPSRAVTAVSVAPPVAASGVRWEPRAISPLGVPLPTVEIKFPIAEQRISSARATQYQVRLKVEHWPLGTSGRGVVLALDDFEPHRITGLEQRLGGLVPGGLTLGAGGHRLLAVAVDDDGVGVKPSHTGARGPFGVVRFHVGERGAGEAEKNGLVLLAPTGKVTTDRGKLLVDYYLFGSAPGPELGPVRLSLAGPGGEWQTETRTPVWVSGLGPGRYHLYAEAEGDRAAHAERTFELGAGSAGEAPP